MNNSNKPSLRPGIYLLMVKSGLGLVIHWPEIGCYEENASSQRKKNMVNLHRCHLYFFFFKKKKFFVKIIINFSLLNILLNRYLTRLTDHQVCFISDTDLESFV